MNDTHIFCICIQYDIYDNVCNHANKIWRSMGGGKLISFIYEFLIRNRIICSWPGSISRVWLPFPLKGFLRM